MHKKRIHINQKWGVNEHIKSKMATRCCCKKTRHYNGILSFSLQKLFYMILTPIIVVSFTHNQHDCVQKRKAHISEPLEIQDGCQGSCMTLFTFTIVSSIRWELYHLRPTMILPVLYIFLWLITTKSLTAGQCYVSNRPPHHPIAVLKRVWSL